VSLRFTKGNYARFDSHQKKTTIRDHQIKEGDHALIGGSRFKPITYCRATIAFRKSCIVGALTDEDARLDGFDSRDELLLELGKVNPTITPYTRVWVYWVTRQSEFERVASQDEKNKEGMKP